MSIPLWFTTYEPGPAEESATTADEMIYTPVPKDIRPIDAQEINTRLQEIALLMKATQMAIDSLLILQRRVHIIHDSLFKNLLNEASETRATITDFLERARFGIVSLQEHPVVQRLGLLSKNSILASVKPELLKMPEYEWNGILDTCILSIESVRDRLDAMCRDSGIDIDRKNVVHASTNEAL